MTGINSTIYIHHRTILENYQPPKMPQKSIGQPLFKFKVNGQGQQSMLTSTCRVQLATHRVPCITRQLTESLKWLIDLLSFTAVKSLANSSSFPATCWVHACRKVKKTLADSPSHSTGSPSPRQSSSDSPSWPCNLLSPSTCMQGSKDSKWKIQAYGGVLLLRRVSELQKLEALWTYRPKRAQIWSCNFRS